MRWTKGLLITSHVAMLSMIGMGCGLNGIKGQLIHIEGNYFVLREPSGHERKLYLDSRTHKDVVQPGDDVQVYINKEGCAEFNQRLENKLLKQHGWVQLLFRQGTCDLACLVRCS
jgi:hypothetical protein